MGNVRGRQARQAAGVYRLPRASHRPARQRRLVRAKVSSLARPIYSVLPGRTAKDQTSQGI